VFGVYSATPGAVIRPDAERIQAQLDRPAKVGIVESWEGEATVAAYSVVHGRDGEPEWALLVCDVDRERRAYARSTERELLTRAETSELVGQPVRLEPVELELPTGPGRRNHATLTS
jgi:acetyl-CoA C-acetyltransferase